MSIKVNKDKTDDMMYFDLPVTYIEGNSADSINAIFWHFGLCNVFSVRYNSLFENYRNETALVFCNFDSSIPLEDMIFILNHAPELSTHKDIVPYVERAFILSDKPLLEQYPDYSREGELWESFIQCIETVIVTKNNKSDLYFLDEYLEQQGIEKKYQEMEKKENVTRIKDLLPSRYSIEDVRRLYKEIFDLDVIGGYKSNLSPGCELYRVTDAKGNVVINRMGLQAFLEFPVDDEAYGK